MADVDSTLAGRFVLLHLPACTCPHPRKRTIGDCRAALGHLLRLSTHGVSSRASTEVRQTPAASELARFHHYLADTCGLAENTCRYRLKHVGDFLSQHERAALTGTGELTAQDIEGFVADIALRWRPSSLGVIRSSLHSFLRFRALAGDDTRMLIAALPRIANWPHSTLPKALSELEAAAFLEAFDQSVPTGLRDFAIARCLLDPGLRGQEAASLQLDALDWRGGTLTIGGTKGRRAHRLPLPSATGKAIARYLKSGRPYSSHRAVFVRHTAPYDKPLSVAGVRSSMNRAFVRCGLADRFCNTHALRRTLAVQLQRGGTSLKEIADVLRHRSLNTSTSYARVDLERLREVALAWPGVVA